MKLMWKMVIDALAASGVIVHDHRAAMKFTFRFKLGRENAEEKINNELIDVVLFCRKRTAEWGYLTTSDDVIIRAMSRNIGFFMNHWYSPIKTENGQLLYALYDEIQSALIKGEVIRTEKKISNKPGWYQAAKKITSQITKIQTGVKYYSNIEDNFTPCTIFQPRWHKWKEMMEFNNMVYGRK